MVIISWVCALSMQTLTYITIVGSVNRLFSGTYQRTKGLLNQVIIIAELVFLAVFTPFLLLVNRGDLITVVTLIVLISFIQGWCKGGVKNGKSNK